MVGWGLALFLGVLLWIMRGVALDLQRELNESQRKCREVTEKFNELQSLTRRISSKQ